MCKKHTYVTVKDTVTAPIQARLTLRPIVKVSHSFAFDVILPRN